MRRPASLFTDSVVRKAAVFWGIVYGVGYLTSVVAFLVYFERPVLHSVVFHLIVLVFAFVAWVVMVLVTVLVVKAIRTGS